MPPERSDGGAPTPRSVASAAGPHDSGHAAADAAGVPAWLAHRGWTIALALLALAPCIAGLYRLDAFGRAREAALATEFWVTAFAPPTWLVLLLIAALSALALALAWRVSHNVAARWLALFSALLASGYGVMTTIEHSALVDGFVRAVPLLRGWGVGAEALRAFGHAVAALERVLWIGAWPLAATVSVFFVRAVLGIGASPRGGRSAAALLVLWSFALVSTSLPHTPMVPVTAGVLALLGLVVWWRARADGHELPPWLLAPGLVLALGVALPQRYPVVPMHVVAAMTILPALLRVAEARPALLLVFPMLLGLAAALHVAGADLTVGLMMPWVGLCMVVLLRTVVARADKLGGRGRRQALWFLSGWAGAALAVLTWQAAVWGGRLAACTVAGPSATCWLHRHQDWFLVAPLPILLLSFVVALLYRGPIDAARLFRRTVVYGSMLMLTLFVLGVSEALLGEFVSRGLPWETPPMLATGILAIVLYPAKRACERGAERLLARILRWSERDAPDGDAAA